MADVVQKRTKRLRLYDYVYNDLDWAPPHPHLVIHCEETQLNRIMIKELAILLYMVLSISCTVLHQPIHILRVLNYEHTPNYNFAYEVNDAHTGDVKSQDELRRGDTVLGQYSLIQPDGLRRTVDYRTDDHTGFQATVNNDGRPIDQPISDINDNMSENKIDVQIIHPLPTPTIATTTQAPAAVSRISLVQSLPNIHITDPWI
ncbi:pupal cuticle protein Edg-84A-like [Achroia grisella]|uniref:pupal cuticle protein Edg-84A-like n=1 Tax=Achroia grisella TaxID=688607 RepID=UPI0027D2EA88|nr:pupal cuticle protein Edg-84A-like [Achroia grisella]